MRHRLITSPLLTVMSGPSGSTSGSTMSSTLWAHLLNKDSLASGPGLKTALTSLGLTASAPADKAGTSVRILLHDTQATIEKFSERADRLLSEAEDSRQKLLARNEEINDEVEKLVRLMIQEQGMLFLPKIMLEIFLSPAPVFLRQTLPNLRAYIDYDFFPSSVGKTETALRSCIGEPAQVPHLIELRQSMSSSLDSLNQRLEAVQNVCVMITSSLILSPTLLAPSLPISIHRPCKP